MSANLKRDGLATTLDHYNNFLREARRSQMTYECELVIIMAGVSWDTSVLFNASGSGDEIAIEEYSVSIRRALTAHAKDLWISVDYDDLGEDAKYWIEQAALKELASLSAMDCEL